MSGESTWGISGRAGEPRVRGGGRRGGGGGAPHRGGRDSTSFFFWKSFGRLVGKIRRLGSNFLGQRSVVDWWMSWVKMKGKVIVLCPLSHGLVKSPRVTESQYESKSLIQVIFTEPFLLWTGSYGMQSQIYICGNVFFSTWPLPNPTEGTDIIPHKTHCAI